MVRQPNYIRPATVIKVYDGDTFTAQILLGFGLTLVFNVRMLGINAPELHAPDPKPGLDSRNFLASQLLGKQIMLETPDDHYDKYGSRIDGIAWLNDVNVNDLMVSSGNAVVYRGSRPPKQLDESLALITKL